MKTSDGGYDLRRLASRSKMLVLQPKRTDLSQIEFARRWRGDHANHAERISSVRSYAQSLIRDDTPELVALTPFVALAYSGVSEAWFDSDDAAVSMTQQSDYRAGALVDEENLFDIPNKVRLIGREFQLMGAHAGSGESRPKVMVFMSGTPSRGISRKVVLDPLMQQPGLEAVTLSETQGHGGDRLGGATEVLVVEITWSAGWDVAASMRSESWRSWSRTVADSVTDPVRACVAEVRHQFSR